MARDFTRVTSTQKHSMWPMPGVEPQNWYKNTCLLTASLFFFIKWSYWSFLTRVFLGLNDTTEVNVFSRLLNLFELIYFSSLPLYVCPESQLPSLKWTSLDNLENTFNVPSLYLTAWKPASSLPPVSWSQPSFYNSLESDALNGKKPAAAPYLKSLRGPRRRRINCGRESTDQY